MTYKFTMAYKLKQCPFCGSKANIIDNHNDSYWGKCENNFCGCELSYEDTYENAVVAWNTRYKSK